MRCRFKQKKPLPILEEKWNEKTITRQELEESHRRELKQLPPPGPVEDTTFTEEYVDESSSMMTKDGYTDSEYATLKQQYIQDQNAIVAPELDQNEYDYLKNQYMTQLSEQVEDLYQDEEYK